MNYRLSLILAPVIFFLSCSPSKQIAKSAQKNVLADEALQTAHVGISIYEPATGKYWFNYQGDKYFVPASNTKLPTCYAAMKYLEDSLVGLRYGIEDSFFVIKGTADPTFLHPDYKNQPSFDFLYQKGVKEKRRLLFALNTTYKFERWGSGWSWNDYGESYMAERSIFPIYGNLVKVSLKDTLHKFISDSRFPPIKKFHPFITYPKYFDSLVNHQEVFFPEDEFKKLYPKAKISRAMESNTFLIEPADIVFRNTEIPFVTDIFTVLDILSDTLNKPVGLITPTEETGKFFYASEDYEKAHVHINKWNVLHSQPTDSLLKPMMHRSDNFFAEQSLLMVSNELLGVMNDAKIIDTLLKTDFKNLPQKPKWVDGSGLSRYNLFTPQDFVFILNKMKTDFGMDRIKTILPTGNEGTLEGRFVRDSNYIFAKTGTLSGVVSLSGFLYTKKNKLLIFSFLVNNHNSSAGEIRRAVEKFIQGIRNQY